MHDETRAMYGDWWVSRGRFRDATPRWCSRDVNLTANEFSESPTWVHTSSNNRVIIHFTDTSIVTGLLSLHWHSRTDRIPFKHIGYSAIWQIEGFRNGYGCCRILQCFRFGFWISWILFSNTQSALRQETVHQMHFESVKIEFRA
jgi:hypothetical protein